MARFFFYTYTSFMPLSLLRNYYSLNNSDITDGGFFPSQEILEGKREHRAWEDNYILHNWKKYLTSLIYLNNVISILM